MSFLKEVLREVYDRGWAYAGPMASPADLLHLASKFGKAVPNAAGTLIQEVKVTPSEQARPNTLSKKYGVAEFPLHTDTAFWRIPARFLIMGVRGDYRRYTTILRFQDIFAVSRELESLAQSAIWRVTGVPTPFYTSTVVPGNSDSYRYDADCMKPVNAAAIAFHQEFQRTSVGLQPDRVDWSGESTIVVDNGRALHGRAPAPAGERERTLYRIYVE